MFGYGHGLFLPGSLKGLDTCSIKFTETHKKIQILREDLVRETTSELKRIVRLYASTFCSLIFNLRKAVYNNANLSFLQVIGQCKVIATTHLNESQDLRVNGFNCTTSSGIVIC